MKRSANREAIFKCLVQNRRFIKSKVDLFLSDRIKLEVGNLAPESGRLHTRGPPATLLHLVKLHWPNEHGLFLGG